MQRLQEWEAQNHCLQVCFSPSGNSFIMATIIPNDSHVTYVDATLNVNGVVNFYIWDILLWVEYFNELIFDYVNIE